ncbi:MAG: ABC transporter permease [Candidatus Halalkalibacterium sp. M3_1C_030]
MLIPDSFKTMLKNYFKIAFRNLRKQKLYSLINILGLSVGLAFCVLVLLFINDELTYDEFHENKDRIYRLYRQPLASNGPIDKDLYMPIPTGPAFKTDFPQVEEYVRFTPFGSNIIRHDGQLFEQSGFAFSDPSVFEVFSFPLLFGNSGSALDNPNSVVLSKEAAGKYFGMANPIGKQLSIRLNSQFYEFEVTGVLENISNNSTIQFDILLPHQKLMQVFEAYSRVENRWDATRLITYLMLREEDNIIQIRARLPEFMTSHMGEMFDEMRAEGTLKSDGPPIIYQLQPLPEVHLDPSVPGGFTEPGNPVYSYILGGIALAVLLIGCINFMLLSIGRAVKRAKEVGLRKVIGAQRGQLMFQFWGEAFLLTLIAFLLGFGLAEAVLPLFNDLAGKELSLIAAFESTTATGILLILFIITGMTAGSYPALILSSFKPIDSLKDKLRLGGSNRYSKALIVVQFSLSVFLIIATLIMADQLNYMQNKNLGFRGDQVVVIPANGTDGERMVQLYRDELGDETNIIDISGANVSFATGLWRRGFQFNGELHQAAVFRVDHNYIETLKMDILEGRDFNPAIASDSTKSIIVNQTFVDEMGLGEDPVSQIFPIDWGWMVNPEIIGVVKDFNYQSLENEVAPAIMYMNPRDPILNMMVRIRPENMSGTIEQLRNTWTLVTNEVPFSYSFLDEDMDQLYQSEQRWSRIIGYGSFFAIFIACLGLFGLAGITAVKRQKEIGIRKILGANVSRIVLLLTKDFALLVTISIAVAVPLAWFVMQEWLQNFAYRTDISLSIILISGGLALVVALATVSWQALRAAFMNPVKNLRSE